MLSRSRRGLWASKYLHRPALPKRGTASRLLFVHHPADDHRHPSIHSPLSLPYPHILTLPYLDVMEEQIRRRARAARDPSADDIETALKVGVATGMSFTCISS